MYREHTCETGINNIFHQSLQQGHRDWGKYHITGQDFQLMVLWTVIRKSCGWSVQTISGTDGEAMPKNGIVPIRAWQSAKK